MKSLRATLNEQQKKSGVVIPTDPWGCPLLMMDADKWIKSAELNSIHFGKYGLDAVMQTHHQNSKISFSGVRFTTWDQITQYIDITGLITEMGNKAVK